MAAYYWQKAAPGLYYCWDKPLDQKDRKVVAKVLKRTRVGWLGAIEIPGQQFETVARTIPAKMVAELELHMLSRDPNLCFHHLNF